MPEAPPITTSPSAQTGTHAPSVHLPRSLLSYALAAVAMRASHAIAAAPEVPDTAFCYPTYMRSYQTVKAG